MEWLRTLLLPVDQGSEFAKHIDFMYMAIFWLSVVLFLGLMIPMCYFAWRYRFKAGRVTPHQTHNTALEVTWTVIPLLLCVALFFWGIIGYMQFAVGPGESMEIQVTAKQWLWQFEFPDGTRAVNELHVPVNKSIHLVMTSEDVLHDFYIPDMRVKRDIVPGRYTEYWFTPDDRRRARFHLRRILRQGPLRHARQGVRRYPGGFRQVDGNRRRRMDASYAGGMGQDSVRAKRLPDLP